MHRSESGDLVECAVCGETVDARSSSSYAFGSESAICFECAVGRGGKYDANEDRWVDAPRTSDLERDEG